MALPHSPLGHRCHGEHPPRTAVHLFEPDRRRVLLAMGAFTVKHATAKRWSNRRSPG